MISPHEVLLTHTQRKAAIKPQMICRKLTHKTCPKLCGPSTPGGVSYRDRSFEAHLIKKEANGRAAAAGTGTPLRKLSLPQNLSEMKGRVARERGGGFRGREGVFLTQPINIVYQPHRGSK